MILKRYKHRERNVIQVYLQQLQLMMVDIDAEKLLYIYNCLNTIERIVVIFHPASQDFSSKSLHNIYVNRTKELI